MILTFVSPISILKKCDSCRDEFCVTRCTPEYLGVANSAIIGGMLANQEERWLDKGLVAYSDSPLIHEHIAVARLSAKIVDGKLCAVSQCVLHDDNLHKTIGRDKFEKLIEDIKDEITGQFSDGLGERIEQDAVMYNGEEVYISLWNSTDWEIKLIDPPVFDDDTEFIKEATFVSIWDDGICVSSPCKVNTKTHEIFDIGENDYPGDDGELDILQSECVRIGEEEFLACPQEYVELNKSSYADGKDHIVYGY